ncbi:MAG: DUF4270 domain-containing protein [Bacteroidales bacterium]|nr:DUF4270 domain-containing protein [Bacteroidales bacterium]
MKFQSFLLIILMSILAFSCTDDNITDMGSKIQPEGDKILIDTATIGLSTENYVVPYLYSRPDSLMLGTFVDYTYGTTYADILTQLQPPLDFSYPAGSVADSAKLILYYYSWFGDKYSPMEVNIYEMNKGKTFEYTKPYLSDIDINEYTDKSVKIGSRIFTAKDAVVIRPDTTTLEFSLSQSFVQRFSPVLNKKYTDDNSEDFHNFFNGLYITTDFGSASMLYIRLALMKYYFHYTYKTKTADGTADSTVVVNSYVNYPANKEVRQINRFQHPDRADIIQNLNANTEVNYISSPANIYTKINVPLKSMKAKMNVSNKKLLINRAVLRVDINDIDDATLAQPITSSLLLIKESAYERFFKHRELPSDTCAILANYSYEMDGDTDNVLYYYSFDLAELITNEFKNDLPDNMQFVLVPVTLQYDGNSNIIRVNARNLMSATKINSGSNKSRPMKIDLVYSGF